ncbi:UNVERIFIED_CONTAM: Lysosomal beta glucosidase [Sesamum radiatum]|uniref:Lysosomal beta glucosidase n=1 Tax=Sesamum radiatum TaxID=300843 RepID=A0AAW2KMQ6_SESRA
MAEAPAVFIGILVLYCWIAVANAEYKIYQDPKQPIGKRVKDLLGRMTLEEKIGQMTQIDRLVASAEVMKKYYIGKHPSSILSGGGSVPSPTASPETWVDMVNGYQKGSLSTRLKIPMLYGIDAVHGHNAVYKATIFPHNVGLGATRQVDFLTCADLLLLCTRNTFLMYRDPELVKRIGAATALEVRATGIPYAFAPCIAVCRDPRWGRCYESYSEDPKVVRAMTEIIPGLQGDIPANSRKGVPFLAGQQKVLATAKHYVGDGGTTKGINENNTLASKRDLLRIHMPAYYDSIIKGVGTIMISYSSWNGVKMHANRDLITGFLKHAAFQEHRELAREAVRKSLVLLKNGESADKPLIPLPKKASKILVAGTHANNIGNQCGGWTIQWQGQPGNITVGTTILTAIKNTVHPETKIVFNENPDPGYVKSNDFSYAIVVVGEPPYSETFGDSTNLTIPDPGPSIITNVCTSVKCVVVLITGRPVVIQPYLEQIDALVAAWLPGTEGQGVADVLFGDYGFTGKLPRTWFKTADQLPMNVGDQHYDPLFPFGYGLTTEPVRGN